MNLFLKRTRADEGKGLSEIDGLVFDFNPSLLGEIDDDSNTISLYQESLEGFSELEVRGDVPIIVENGLNGTPVARFSGESVISSKEEVIQRGGSYSIVSVSRYSGSKRERVISSKDNNWLFGFHAGAHNSLFCGEWLFEGSDENCNEWQIHSGVFDIEGPNFRFCNSGVLVSEGNFNFDVRDSTIGRISLGGWKGQISHCSNCEIARVLVFDRALEEIEIRHIEMVMEKMYSLSDLHNEEYLDWVGGLGDAIFDYKNIVKYSAKIAVDEGRMKMAAQLIENIEYSEKEFHFLKHSLLKENPPISLESSYMGFFLDPFGIEANEGLIFSKIDNGLEMELVDYCNILRSLCEAGLGSDISRESVEKITERMSPQIEPLLSLFLDKSDYLYDGRFREFFLEMDRFLSSGISDFSEIINNRIDGLSSENKMKEIIVDLLNENGDSDKVIRYSTEFFKFNKRRSVGGYADRIKGITTVMLLSIALGRRFEIDWKVPFELEEIFTPVGYDWRVRVEEEGADKIVMIDRNFSDEIREKISSSEIEGALGITNNLAEAYCNIYNHDCMKNEKSVVDFSDYYEFLNQPNMVGSALSLFGYKPNLAESAIINNFLQFIDRFEDSIVIHFRTGGDGDWEDPSVDSPENVFKLFDYAEKVIANSGKRTCIYFASDSKELKNEVLKKYGGKLEVFVLNIPIFHIDRSVGKNLYYGSRFSIMENYLISMCNHILAGKGAYSVLSANRRNQWPWRYFKTH